MCQDEQAAPVCRENDKEAKRRGLLTSGEVSDIRHHLGLSVSALAAELGCDPQELDAIEAGYALIDTTQDRYLRQFKM